MTQTQSMGKVLTKNLVALDIECAFERLGSTKGGITSSDRAVVAELILTREQLEELRDDIIALAVMA